MSLRARARSARSLQRVGDGRVEVERRHAHRRRVDRLERDAPVVALRRIEDEEAQPILGLLHRRFGDDQLLLIGGDFGLRRHEVERRRLADVDFRLVHAHQLFGQRSAERRASTVACADTRFQYAAFTSAVVWTMRLAQTRVGDVAVDAAGRELLARRRR